MRKSNFLLFLILIALLNACSEQKDGVQKDYITEADMSLLTPDTVNGETVAQSNKRGEVFRQNLKSNTIDKYIPNVPIYDLSGAELSLQDVISKKTILISSDSYCGFGGESLRNDFPGALDSLKNELQDYDIICLIKRTEWDKEDSTRFEGFKEELREIYETLYIIEESDAYRINLIGSPMRYYVDENQKVAHIGSGLSSVANQILEIRSFTGINSGS